jgi:hypothetical protein
LSDVQLPPAARSDPGSFWWLIFVYLWVAFLILTMTIARSDGHSPLQWGLVACFLPGITVIIVLMLPTRAQTGAHAATWFSGPEDEEVMIDSIVPTFRSVRSVVRQHAIVRAPSRWSVLSCWSA